MAEDSKAFTLHFQPAGPRAEREAAVKEWRDWWTAHRHTFKKRWGERSGG
ncbi:hypothetical protein ACQKGO_03605 [Corallococcus interemptor]